MKGKIISLGILLVAMTGAIYAQSPVDSSAVAPNYFIQDSIAQEQDIVDAYYKLTNRKPPAQLDQADSGHLEFALIPFIGYSLQTRFAGLLAANVVVYAKKGVHKKPSTFLGSIAYTQNRQIILPVAASIWTNENRYNLISDMRYMDYPSQTYGLGPQTDRSDGYDINFSYIKLHQSMLRSLSHNFYAGMGYYYDYLWKIHEVNLPPDQETSFQEYGLYDSEVVSGTTFEGLFDNRENQVNPSGGFYAKVRYRLNYTWMGSNTNWQSGVLEMKKYLRFRKKSKNVLALWNYNWLTLFGKPPYLLLPSTGWDDFFNTGRGYIQGRFRDMNMSYLEAEYRFRLVKSGLFGAVVYANMQTFSNGISSLYQVVIPGYGAGLRVKLNRNSNTNLCVDYAFGKEGSRGFFINLGEVF